MKSDPLQDEAKDKASELKVGEWRAYTADKQTKGRGTRQRTWVSPPDNIYVTYSFLDKLSKIQPVLSFFPQVAGYSVAEMLAEFKLDPKFKWPNDILLNQKKMCGILCESSQRNLAEEKYYVVHIGIGVNVNMEKEICEGLDQPVTSMSIEAKQKFDKEKVIQKLNETLYKNTQLLLEKGFVPFAKLISQKIETYDNGEILFDAADDGSYKSIIKGKIVGVGDKGQLILNGSYLSSQEQEFKESQNLEFITGRILRGQEISLAMSKWVASSETETISPLTGPGFQV